MGQPSYNWRQWEAIDEWVMNNYAGAALLSPDHPEVILADVAKCTTMQEQWVEAGIKPLPGLRPDLDQIEDRIRCLRYRQQVPEISNDEF